MGSKRGQKAKKRAKREARRETRRAQREPTPVEPNSDPRQTHVGYIAFNDKELYCYRGDCLVAHSRQEIQRTAHLLHPESKANFVSASFGELIQAMEEEQVTFCFDDEAYRRFAEAARRCGMPIDSHWPRGSDLRIVDAPGMVLSELGFLRS